LATLLLTPAIASAETRVLKFYHLHTHERAAIAYKRDGRYLPDGLRKINHILRDWRENEEVKINPRLLDLLWQVYRVSGSNDYINVICGYRSPKTNKMLRSRSSGVAKQSQHKLGNAIDFYLPDVPLSKLRKIGLKMQDGGVGYYPSSGSPFVHMDVGNVRHWPRMSRSQLVALFPDGKTMHIPSDGKPLSGYNVALAAYKSRVRNDVILTADNADGGGSKRGLLAALFGGGADEEEDRSGVDDVPASRPTAVAAAPQAAEPEQKQPIEPATILAALPARAVPIPRVAPRPDVDVGPTPNTVVALAEAAPAADASQAENIVEKAANAKLAALNVPLPTWRPAYTAPESDGKTAAIVLADASATASTDPDEAADAIAEILKANQRPELAPTATAYLPVPGTRPDEDVPEAQSVALSSAAEKFAETLAAAEDLAPATLKAPVGSPRLAMLSDPSGKPDPDIFAGVKTTAKGARVRPSDEKRNPQAIVVPVKVASATWALRGESILASAERGSRPEFDPSLVQSPETVYTAGFRKEVEVADARRFTGSAVKFMSVARFESE
jgi:uncharacterized protein YcbK (DUF882 family)